MKAKYLLDVSEWKGSLGVWGAVAPVYDTTEMTVTEGVHVHARTSLGGDKAVDETFGQVTIANWGDQGQDPFVIHGGEAIHYMVAAVLGLRTKPIQCPMCGHSHLDEDWFAVHPHQSHLCAQCNGTFRDNERAIGNPIGALTEGVEIPSAQAHPGVRKELRQRDYPGGIQLWGSNPAIFAKNQTWDSRGIHLHTFRGDGEIVDDDTFAEIVVDGLALDPAMVRAYMAQSTLAHLRGCVVDLSCPDCGTGHFDRAEFAFTPHEFHTCERCGEEFRGRNGSQQTIGNPIVSILARLREMACQELC